MKIRSSAAATLLLLALCAQACGGGEPTAEESGTTDHSETTVEQDPQEEANVFSVLIAEPASLTPQNSTEVEGGEVLYALFSGLVEYDPETARPIFGDDAPRAMAESVESDDQQNWTITIKQGWTFHDGTPVTAQSFVDAWNFGAYQPNAQQTSYFFANIEGYDALQCAEEDVDEEGTCTADPETTEMSGLSAADDRTIEVSLSAPFSQFPLTIGYSAFYPLPEVAFEDPEAFNEAPVGNGPFQMDGTWTHDEGIRVRRYEEYAGEPAVADGVEFRIYQAAETGYNDLLAGNLDIMEDIPGEQVEQAREELGDRFMDVETSALTFLGFPLYDERFANPDVRMAISMAIDRQAIADNVKPGAQAADSFVSPVVAGYEAGACGRACTYDPEAAAALLEAAGGFEGVLTLWYPSESDDQVVLTAVANQLGENLGIEVEFEAVMFAEFLSLADDEGFDGPYSLGWVMDYPSPQNYLEPLHATGASSNNTGFSDQGFDDLIAEGNAAASVEEGLASYQEAEAILAEQVPFAPMFFDRLLSGHSERVDGVVVDPFTRLNTADITVSEG